MYDAIRSIGTRVCTDKGALVHRIDGQSLDREFALWAMALGLRPVFPSNRAKPLPIIGRASRRRHDPSMMTFLRFMPSRAAPRLSTLGGENFFGGVCGAPDETHADEMQALRHFPRSHPGEIREIREILHPFREGSVSIRGTALGAGIDRHSMSEASSSDGHNGPRRQRQRFPRLAAYRR